MGIGGVGRLRWPPPPRHRYPSPVRAIRALSSILRTIVGPICIRCASGPCPPPRAFAMYSVHPSAWSPGLRCRVSPLRPAVLSPRRGTTAPRDGAKSPRPPRPPLYVERLQSIIQRRTEGGPRSALPQCHCVDRAVPLCLCIAVRDRCGCAVACGGEGTCDLSHAAPHTGGTATAHTRYQPLAGGLADHFAPLKYIFLPWS